MSRDLREIPFPSTATVFLGGIHVVGIDGARRLQKEEALQLVVCCVDTLKACINVDHIEENTWGPPLVDADWHALDQAIYEDNGKSCIFITKIRVRQQDPGSQVRVKKQKPLGP